MKRQRLQSHLIPFFGDMPLSKISPLDIERYKHQRAKEAVEVRPRGKTIVRGEGKATQTKPATINRELAVLSHLFNMAIDWGWIDRRPTRIKRLTESQGRITYLTVEQVARLIECAKQDQNPQVYPFIVIGVETSMRRMEICPFDTKTSMSSGASSSSRRQRPAQESNPSQRVSRRSFKIGWRRRPTNHHGCFPHRPRRVDTRWTFTSRSGG